MRKRRIGVSYGGALLSASPPLWVHTHRMDGHVRRSTRSPECEDPPLLAIMEGRAPAPAPSPQEMFVCTRFSTLRLGRGNCARRWTAAQERRPGPWDSLHPCLTCPTGAAHAGCPGGGRFAPAEALRGICTRCALPASRGFSGRMVRDRFCISCYNRHREALRGRNAKGTRPGLVLRDVALDVEEGGVVRRVRHNQVVSAAEAMLAEARRARGPLAFLGAPPRPAEDGWRPVPHVCRSCLGRVLECAGAFRCSDCGFEDGTALEDICGCGLQVTEPPVARQSLFRCGVRKACGLSASEDIVITFGERAGGIY